MPGNPDGEEVLRHVDGAAGADVADDGYAAASALKLSQIDVGDNTLLPTLRFGSVEIIGGGCGDGQSPLSWARNTGCHKPLADWKGRSMLAV